MFDGHSSTTLVRAWLFGAFQVERRSEDGTWETSDKSHWEKGYARPLFKRLLCTGGRRVERLTLADDLWPDPDSPELVERYLNDAAYQLRKALRPVPILKTFGHASGYELAAQSLLWVDADACEALMREAEQIGRTSAPALPLLEQANAYFARGDFLEGESGLWVYARRGTLERLRYRCRIWLAEAYEQQGMMGQAEMLYSGLLEDTPSDEDVLCRLMGLLHRQGMTHATLRCFEATKKHLKHLGLRLSPTTDTYAKRLLSEPRPIELYGGTSLTSRKHPLHPSITQDIIGEQELEGADMDHLRRQIIQQALKVTGTAVLTEDILLNTDMAERLLQVLTKPSSIDEKMLSYLEHRTDSYWQDRNGAALASYDLLSYVSAHLQKITAFLEGSLFPSDRIRLCSIMGTTAFLVGALLYDMSYYAEARKFYRTAIKAAQEANNTGLEAVIWGWVSFSYTYDKNPQAALASIQKARYLAARGANTTVCAWLAAVEAEIQTNLGNFNACLTAFEGTRLLEEQTSSDEDSYWIHFDRSLLAGYKGACFRRLYRPDDTRTHIHLRDAQVALIDAIADLDPTLIRRLPTFYIDLAATYIPEKEAEQACKHALQAVTIVAQIKAQTVLQRLLTLRQDLEPWKETEYVRNLDVQIEPLLTSTWYRSNG